jgi:anti-sigma B factor antagonist
LSVFGRSLNFVSVKLSTRQVSDIVVMDVSGRITLGESSTAMRDAIRALTEQGNKKVLLNLGGLIQIDSSGLGELVSGYTTMVHLGGALKLLGLTKQVKQVMQITKIYNLFEVYEDEAEAVRSFT